MTHVFSFFRIMHQGGDGGGGALQSIVVPMIDDHPRCQGCAIPA